MERRPLHGICISACAEFAKHMRTSANLLRTICEVLYPQCRGYNSPNFHRTLANRLRTCMQMCFFVRKSLRNICELTAKSVPAQLRVQHFASGCEELAKLCEGHAKRMRTSCERCHCHSVGEGSDVQRSHIPYIQACKGVCSSTDSSVDDSSQLGMRQCNRAQISSQSPHILSTRCTVLSAWMSRSARVLFAQCVMLWPPNISLC
jgi:hypothetical protein